MATSRTPNQPDDRPLSALPSTSARLIAFGAILVAGVFGGLIGYGFTDLQGDDVSSTAASVGALIGAVLAAGGTAIVAVLVLRAMGEWNQRRPRA